MSFRCILCDKLFDRDGKLYRHIGRAHLRRTEVPYPGLEKTKGICFCGRETARFLDHCKANHPKMSIDEICAAITLGVNP